MFIKLLFIVLFGTFIILPQEAGRVYVLSEGGFSSGSAKLGMLNNHTGAYTENILPSGSPGLYPDGLIYSNGYIYLAEQGSFGGAGKVYKIDTTGMIVNFKVTGVNPYSLAVTDGKIFVTNGPAGNVTVLDENTMNVLETITVGVYPQEIIAHAGKVFIANTSLFGGAEDNTVSVIDPVSGTQVKKITVRKDPSSLAVSKDGFLLVACPGSGNDGVIYKIDPAAYVKIDSFFFSSEGVSKDISVDFGSNKIYYISYNGNIVETDLVTRQSAVIITGAPGTNYYYGYNYDYHAKKHYVLDAKSFMVNGSLNVHNSFGALINTYETGTAPRRVVFKYNINPTAVEEKHSADKSVNLMNYPNPFRERTIIRYQVSGNREHGSGNRNQGTGIRNQETGIGLGGSYGGVRVSLSVFDLLGREIAKPVDEVKAPGVYETDFSAAGLASGIYLCELKAGNERRVIKLIFGK